MPSKLQRIKVKLTPAVILDDDGYGSLVSQISEALAREGTFECSGVTLELRPAILPEADDVEPSAEEVEEETEDKDAEPKLEPKDEDAENAE